ncbi:CRISPR-associated endoribonuclease Cas6 [Clostridium tyrobutyricum]|uniref:CRISPR-associated endoribonuclease Cas6 n=1 Tax=Clostridium tyrobutyricum TaxID=1519 RepID=UPI001C38B5A4|nr:CRISPR-associated endoribonuclease Cas6 [Clostridium tyrobutyricum]MBR9648898.1 CRISPR-associated endoribonuclease Cas6 [Clostridium tyrobutyricum]MBV4417624.1 CRISPR-associated endoribonuclease Cas6 [Clostridium tyrobutyricum]
MRFKCTFKTEKIPIAYHMMFVSMIKEALKEEDEEYLNKLYFFGDKYNKKSKNFTFSVYLRDYKINGYEIKINDSVDLNISSPDVEFMMKLYNGILKKKSFSYKKIYNMDKMRISMQPEKHISKGKVCFKTLSPIFLKDKNGKSVSTESDEYSREFNYIQNKILENYRGYGLRENLEFIPVLMEKKVVKEEISKFKKISGKDVYCVESYSGIFKLCGDVKDLNDIYMLGVGFRRSQGFGMIEVV